MKKNPTCFIPIRGEVWPIVLVWPRNLSTEMPVPSQEESDHVYTYVCVCVSTLSHLCVCLCIDFVTLMCVFVYRLCLLYDFPTTSVNYSVGEAFPPHLIDTMNTFITRSFRIFDWYNEYIYYKVISYLVTMNTFITRSFRIFLQWIHLLQGHFVSCYNEYIYYKVISYLVTMIHLLQGHFVSWCNEYIYYKVISYLVTIMYFLLQDIKQYLISQQKFYPIQ